MTKSDKTVLDSLKTSNFDRRMSIAKTSLNLGRRWASNSLGNLFASQEDKAARKHEFMQQQADYLVTELGKLKGSVVKIGQMMALYSEHVLPPEVTTALQNMNDNTASLAWETIHKQLQQQLGDKLDALEIDTVPIGTASLAQVHRAKIKSTGEQVVLKVQYPGVADAIDSDLSLFKNLLKITNVVPQTQAFDGWFDEVKDLLYREVDYLLEAKTTQAFYARLQHDPRYVVPRIIPEFCSERVICMTYESGIAITSDDLQALSQERRNRIGQAAIEVMMREIFDWGEMQTDPNFGNYLVRLSDTPDDPATPDKMVLLDFGAIRQFDEQLLSIAKNLLSAGYHHSLNQMFAAVSDTGYEFFDKISALTKEDLVKVFLLATEPFCLPSKNPDMPANCLDENGCYIWANSELHARLVQKSGKAMQNVEFVVPPKEFMFISRKFIGAYTLLTVLDGRTDSDKLVKPFL